MDVIFHIHLFKAIGIAIMLGAFVYVIHIIYKEDDDDKWDK